MRLADTGESRVERCDRRIAFPGAASHQNSGNVGSVDVDHIARGERYELQRHRIERSHDVPASRSRV
jgi:hypothetical protein